MPKLASSTRPEWYFALGQIVLGLCFLLCVILIPHYFFSLDQGGVSNYGTESATKLLFAVGFGAASLGTFLAGLKLPTTTSHRTQLRYGLYVLALLYLFVMLSTFSYKLNDSLRHLHGQVSLALFAYAFLGTLWLRFVAVKDVFTKWAFVAFCLSFVVVVLTVMGYIHFLFVGQIASGIAFASLVTHCLAVLRSQKK